ncbi:SDR family NAD(P)-dependent oxidoreductase [Nonomuraea sp. NPDC049400]|uniref:SDR family NAD(P)-dependent oxidoreductase n=1 Tax=Nonomuraea sp. NPDC049400 TaxID=3364352 RepID=UPI003793A4D3
MRTIVVSGGTSGIREGLAHAHLDRGDQVVVIGSDPAKGTKLLTTAQTKDAGDRVFFLCPDLSLVSENQRVIEEIGTRFAQVDALVLCARYFTPPADSLSAFVEGRRISLMHPSFDKQAAARLDALTRALLQQHERQSMARLERGVEHRRALGA